LLLLLLLLLFIIIFYNKNIDVAICVEARVRAIANRWRHSHVRRLVGVDGALVVVTSRFALSDARAVGYELSFGGDDGRRFHTQHTSWRRG
jgi:hypothetical protein